MSKRYVPDRNKVIFNHGYVEDWDTQKRLDDLEDDARNREVTTPEPDLSDLYKQIADLQNQIDELGNGGDGGNTALPPMGNLIYWLPGGSGYYYDEDFAEMLVGWDDASGSGVPAYAAEYAIQLVEDANLVLVPKMDVHPKTGGYPSKPKGEPLFVLNGDPWPSVFPSYMESMTVAVAVHHEPDVDAIWPNINPYPDEYSPAPQVIAYFQNYYGPYAIETFAIARSPGGKVRIYHGPNWNDNYYDTTADFPSDPCMIVVRTSSTGMLVRLNGETVFSTNTAHDFTSQETGYFMIGSDKVNGYGWSGTINEVLVYDTSLVGSQVIAIEDYLVKKFDLNF